MLSLRMRESTYEEFELHLAVALQSDANLLGIKFLDNLGPHDCEEGRGYVSVLEQREHMWR